VDKVSCSSGCVARHSDQNDENADRDVRDPLGDPFHDQDAAVVGADVAEPVCNRARVHHVQEPQRMRIAPAR
jgi:hypothetical protein